MRILLKPRSIAGLVVASHALVALPLAIIALVAAFYSQQLATRSNTLLAGGIRVTQLARGVEDALIGMERAARQYQVLGEPTLRELFRQRHAEMTGLLAELRQGGRVAERNLLEVGADADAVAGALELNDPSSPILAVALDRFSRMHNVATAVNNEARHFIEAEAEQLQRSTARYQDVLIILCAVLVPLAAGIAVILAFYVGAPLQRMDAAIADLGAGRWSRPITVGGPAELQAVGGQLDWLRERLRTVEQDKNRFLRHISHELKTPLASVREGAELLADGVAGPLLNRQQEIVGLLRNSSVDLQILIENLFAYEQWRERRGELDRVRFALPLLIDECVARYRVKIETKGIRVATRCEARDVYADRQRMRLILDNLISNAIKYSPERGTVTVRAHTQGAGADQSLLLEVADEGSGIPADARARMFEAFYQGPPPPGEHLQGTGVGLAMVRDCVDAHGGSIELLDGQFPGAHFRIRIPMPPVPPGAGGPPAPGPAARELPADSTPA